mgnify:CR=1 FL=1|tara:strand:+ start:553 stop:1011 length:459 start_codon:yes stop_codon:yes gene_type:complete
MSDGISMTFMNYSQTNWDQSASLTNDDEDWGISSLSTYPSSTLAQGASTSMSVDENIMGNVDKGQITISCGWYDTSVSDSHWGVKIYVPVQVFDIGSRPYYLVVETETEDWTQPVDDPSKPYSFTTPTGKKVNITPVSGHTSLSLTISITDP